MGEKRRLLLICTGLLHMADHELDEKKPGPLGVNCLFKGAFFDRSLHIIPRSYRFNTPPGLGGLLNGMTESLSRKV